MSAYRRAIRHKLAERLSPVDRSLSVGQRVRPKCPYSRLNHPNARIEIQAIALDRATVTVVAYYATGEVVVFPIKAESLIAG